jgi:hypothetical protein
MRAPIFTAGLALLFSGLGQTHAADLIMDRPITVHTSKDASARRRALIAYLWGNDGFPKHRLPEKVVTNIPSPVKQLDSLKRVDELRIELAPGLQGLAYHFIPERANSQLVVVHHGHACTLDDDPSDRDAGYGLQRTIRALLQHGYGVLGVFMPHMRPGDCTGQHEEMFQIHTAGSPIKFFLESTTSSLNYLQERNGVDDFPRYRKFHMIGLSGGGWTTTVYAAIDPRISCSFSVAGTIPLYLRSGGSIGDREQFEPSFYQLAGYPDLYIMGAEGKRRQQLQILLRKDDCCFGEAQHDAKACGAGYDESMREFERRVQDELKKIGRGSFRVEIDETAPSHMISHHVIKDVILPELARFQR